VRARSIVITGATSGIGRALAIAYAQPEARLCLLGRDAGRMAQVRQACEAGGAQVETALVDVRDRDALIGRIAAWDEQRPLDLAIASAGIAGGLGPGRDLESSEAVHAILAVDLGGVLATLDAVLPRMMARRAGQAAVLGSLAALRGLPSSPAYSAAKAAVHAYAEGLRPRLRRHGVDLTVIAPGFVETPLNRDIRSPRPLQVSAERAASIIRRGIDQRRPMVSFPFVLYAGLRLLGLLPARLGDHLLDRPAIEVPPPRDGDRRWA
jgi:NADP-dependent 3-hydroxy acid dehydrogenase YdfG